VRLYHPNLKPPTNEYETTSDDPLHVQVYLDAGWLLAPEPEAAVVGRAPEPVRYEPVAKPSEAPSRPAASGTRDEWVAYVEYLGGDTEGKTIAELKAAADEIETDK